MLHAASGVDCSIKVNWATLREHGKTVSETDPRRLSCYVATPPEEAGSEFVIYWDTPSPRDHDMVVYLTLDGNRQRAPTPHYASAEVGMACGEPDGPDRERPYQFAPIVSRLARAKSADDSDSDAEEAGDALKRGVGTILVEFRTCRIGKAMDYFPNLGGPAEGRAVTERGVKGQLVHKTSFGQAREAKGTSYLDFDLIGHVICAFEFRYRSQGLLEADGIAEASPEPVPERAAGDVKPKIEGNVEHAAVADPQPQAEAQPAVTGGPGPSGSGLDAAADVKPKVGAATAAARGKRTPSSPPENGDASDAKPQDSDATADKGKKRARTDDLDRVQDDEMERLRRENRMLMEQMTRQTNYLTSLGLPTMRGAQSSETPRSAGSSTGGGGANSDVKPVIKPEITNAAVSPSRLRGAESSETPWGTRDVIALD